MAASKDRVAFFFGPRYFTRHGTPSTGMNMTDAEKVLDAAFGDPSLNKSWRAVFSQHPEGFNIICRPSQFARFIVFRFNANIGVNGIKDLNPKLYNEVDRIQAAADNTGLSRAMIRSVLIEVGLNPSNLKSTVSDDTFDVSGCFDKSTPQF